MAPVASADLRLAIRELGLFNRAVCAHSALSSFEHLEGGADAFVEAFLLEGCTLLVPSFTWSFCIAPPAGMRPLRNAFHYERGFTSPIRTSTYTPNTDEIDDDMGAIPRAIVRRPDRARGVHPLCSFAAVGPGAQALVEPQSPPDVFAPLEALADQEGLVLLAGVGLPTMTLLHLAEVAAGRQPFRRWAKLESGDVIEAASGGCGTGFGALESVLNPIAREKTVGGSRWRVFPAREALEIAARAIAGNPQVTHCADPNCLLCADAIAGGPII
jgi:aminoglycoside 3-N-acetyltransferase